MIYEMRTYDLKPRSLPEVEKRFGEAYEHRKKYSPLAAFWHTEIGPLNQIVHVWPYKDMEERNRIRAEAGKKAVKEGGRDYRLECQENKILMPSSFSPLQ